MHVKIFKEYALLSEMTAKEVAIQVEKKAKSVLCFPSGDTPIGLFVRLADFHKKGTIDFSSCRFVGLDEWLGMDETDEGSCKHTLYHELFYPLGIQMENIVFFDAKAGDPNEECERIDRIIHTLGGVDLMILGVGMNGHLGLNEPGVNENLYSHLASLHPVTKKVGQKYFKGTASLTKGYTLGLKHIMEAKHVIGMISGNHKAEIARIAIEGDISSQVPASLMRNHNNATIYLDEEAAKFLNKQNV